MNKREMQQPLMSSQKIRDLIDKIQGIREPLNVISGAAHYLGMKVEDFAEKEVRHIEIIKEQIKLADERINTIINDVQNLE